MNIKVNSKKVKPNDVFIAIKGNTYDGHQFIDEAIKNGASSIICEYGTYSIPYVKVSNTKEYLNNYLYTHYYDKIKDITLIGITGTNGKTTSCYLLYEMLKLLNVKCAYIGTIGFYIDSKVCDLDNTTPELLDLYDMFLKCKSVGVKVIVMEVSSHALYMDRVKDFKYDYVVFTNLTADHLLLHKTMENYMNTKKKLFTKLKSNGVSISNVDDEYSSNFIFNNTITYGMNDADYNIEDYKLYMDKTIYILRLNNKKYKVRINMPGKYNIYNSVISLIILKQMGYKLNRIIKLLSKVNLPSGRMEIVKYKKNIIVIDYAHTTDAIEKVLNSGNEIKRGKIYVVVGCGGNRDKSKRKDMALVSTMLSDYVIFTNDNPRDEEPSDIINDMIHSLNKDNYEVILDRKTAIRRGIDLLDKCDMLFILGKGHEDYQIIKEIKYHLSDKEEVIKYIGEK